ncbi:hypothetical protein TNCV_1239511 [Trichonephila clavipes]|nr:hypothetical protein TNCV_1239511 [Trichonephila clavipes]
MQPRTREGNEIDEHFEDCGWFFRFKNCLVIQDVRIVGERSIPVKKLRQKSLKNQRIIEKVYLDEQIFNAAETEL